MRFVRTGGASAFVVVMSGAMATCANAAVFTDLGLPFGNITSHATALSANGNVVAGYSGSDNFPDSPLNSPSSAFRWTPSGGATLLSGDKYPATGISADGSTVTGGPYVWRTDGTTQVISGVGISSPIATGISADGAVAVGFTRDVNVNHAFRWTPSTGAQDIGFLPGGNSANARATNSDGGIVVGFGGSSSGTRAFRWTPAGGMQSLGVLGGRTFSEAYACNSDGSFIAGFSGSGTSDTHAFRWNAATGLMRDLGVLPNTVESVALGINASGSMVVGYSGNFTGDTFLAYLWTPSQGMLDLNAYLPSLGIDLTGWTLRQAVAISADGTAICGYGTFNGGGDRAWVVTGVPTPGVLVVLGVGAGMAARRRRRSLHLAHA